MDVLTRIFTCKQESLCVSNADKNTVCTIWNMSSIDSYKVHMLNLIG